MLKYIFKLEYKTAMPKCKPAFTAMKDIKFKVAYWISSNPSFIQYCDSNIRLFSIAPPLAKLSLLKAIAKSKGKIIAPSRS
jgi:hypothetical protein